jgi:Glycoside Hydrolase Family 113
MNLRSFTLTVVLMLSGVMPATGQPHESQLGFIKGVTWGWPGARGDYASATAVDSMRRLADTGAEWVCLAFAPDMPTFDTPTFEFADANRAMVTDAEVRRAVELARRHGLRVILKPMIDCADGTWRAWIRFYRPVTDAETAQGISGEFDPWGDEPQFRHGLVRDRKKWNQWWDNYTKYITHYARLAEEEQVPIFCVGCELNSTEEFEDRWRELIRTVRRIYSGLITYDVDHGDEERVQWFDTVDIISVSAYYPVPLPEGWPVDSAPTKTTTAEIRAATEQNRKHLAAVSEKWGKPILFLEAGCTSVRGGARTPWEYFPESDAHPVDENEQANYYQAMFETYWHEPWFAGWCWWEWPARLRDADTAWDRDFSFYGKEAEDVLRTWYAKPRPAPQASER